MNVKGFIRTPVDYEIKIVNESERIIEGYASTADVDRVNDVVVPTAFEKSIGDFMKGSHPLLYNHNIDNPVGKIIGAKIDDKGLFVKASIGKGYGKADEVWNMILDGVLKSFSIGFIPRKWEYKKNGDAEIRYITDVDLLEISVVTVPANKEAIFEVADGKAVNIKMIDDTADVKNEEYKKASGKLDWPLADRYRRWSKRSALRRIRKWASKDGSGAIDTLDWRKYQSVHFWYDENAPELVTSYKLLFCDVIDGKVYAIPRAIFACAVVIQGGRGGLDIPEKDLPAVKRRVEHYYERMGETAPWKRKDSSFTFEELDAYAEFKIDMALDELADRMDRFEHEMKEIIDKVNAIEAEFKNNSPDDGELDIDELKSIIANTIKTIKGGSNNG